jgi:predicted RND superfamily exporter protein
LSDEDIKQQESGDSEMTHERDIELKEFEADEAMSNGMWYAIANKLLEPRFGISVLVAVLCLCAPVCSFCLSVETSIDFDMTVPSDADTYDVFEDVEKQFGAGSVFPYRLLLIPKYDFCGKSNFCANPLVTECDAGLMCSDGLTAVNNVLESIAAAGEKHSAVSQFSGVTQLDGNEITYADYEAAFIAIAEGNPTSYQESIALLYASSCQTHTTVEGTTIVENLCWTTFTTIIIAESPFSEKGTEWLIKVRDEIDRLKKEDLFEIYLANGAGMTYDVTVAVYDAFPMIVIITLAVVFVLMAFAFESLVAPLRSVLTLALTLAFVYGLAVLVYQHGAFSFLNMRCLSDSGGISWLPPVMCFSIIVGLGLDYDVFLISRVYEFRANGYTDHSAAVKGICSTGFIITAAGMIMAVAFGGLFTSTELILNQTAFLLVFAVLLDTFVVRTLCVPALLGLTDHFSWWPGEMTPATKTIGF